MKRLLMIMCAATALLAGLWSCTPDQPEPVDAVELRYKVEDSYELDAISPKSFNIMVTSSKKWTITSQHPDWCIISEEEGEASDEELVHVGQGTVTKVTVQYYDNTDLDTREDVIEIASGGWIGKKVAVTQKGIAFMDVPEAELEEGMFLEKAGGELSINVDSNQNWSAKVTEGDNWLSIIDGATGSQKGVIKLQAKENTGEKRYATVTVYDRHDEELYFISITQDGVQLDPEALEIRAGYDQLSATLSVVSNAKWVAEKSAADDWFSVDNPDGHEGNDVLNVTLTDNTAGTSMRKGTIILKTIAANPGDAVAEREITVKQAYPIKPVRYIMDNDQMGAWESDWANPPVYTKDIGTLFTAKARLHNGSMPAGNYTFCWSNVEGAPRIRHWFCYSNSAELKVDIRPAYTSGPKISFDFNAPGGLSEQKPALSSSEYKDIDVTKPMELTIKFDPSGAEYCHVTYLYNGVEMVSYDTSPSTMNTTTWGSKINMYIGCEVESTTATGFSTGSAILEWFEYVEPMNWDE